MSRLTPPCHMVAIPPGAETWFGSVPLTVRRVLWEAQDRCCGLCRQPLEWRRMKKGQAPGALDPTVDHVVPRTLRGPDAVGNILLAHAMCNTAKGSRWPTEAQLAYLAEVNARLLVRGQPLVPR